MTDSKIILDTRGRVQCYSGHDATLLYSVIALRAAIKLQRVGIKPFRGCTMRKLLTQAEVFTGVKYKRDGHKQAIDGLTVWIETMKSALPVEQGQ